MPVSLTRRITFHARHRYWVAAWSPEENRARFGWTSETPAHGHLYQCAATVTGAPDPETGMIIDLVALDRILAEEVLVLDGSELNRDVAEFATGMRQPSCEALAALLYARVAARLPVGVSLERLRLAEDAGLHADCTGIP
jgi:6-pyruvoyltetrahydropterin/6-carboxytetrahydropterin synthase